MTAPIGWGKQIGATYPDWYTPAKDRSKQNRRVLFGLHPMGERLGGTLTTCGTCANLGGGSPYFKCRLVGVTRSVATDIRKKWRGCIKWFPSPTKSVEPVVAFNALAHRFECPVVVVDEESAAVACDWLLENGIDAEPWAEHWR